MPSPKNACPVCGKMKSATSQTCRDCYTPTIPQKEDYNFIRECQGCKKQFHITHSRQFFCTDCRTRQCVVCGKSFTASTTAYIVTCSKECSKLHTSAPMLACLYCGVDFKQRGGRPTKYCSKECRYKAALVPSTDPKRRSNKYRKWRGAVLTRDGFTCQDCGATTNLTTHHLKEWAKFPELRYDVDNGITLCEDCHTMRHYGKRVIKRSTKIKHCVVCNVVVSIRNKSTYCRSCAVRLAYQRKKAS